MDIEGNFNIISGYPEFILANSHVDKMSFGEECFSAADGKEAVCDFLKSNSRQLPFKMNGPFKGVVHLYCTNVYQKLKTGNTFLLNFTP